MKLHQVKNPQDIKEEMREYFKNIKIDKETVNIKNALNRIVYEDVLSKVDIPDFDKSTVDGFAVKASDVYGASESIPAFLNYKGQVEMGKDTDLTVDYDECVYVPTGGKLPEGSNAVVMIEYTEEIDEETIAVYRPLGEGENIIKIGEDMKKEEILLKKGRKIKSYDLGVLSAQGIWEIDVYKKPKVSIISTGDELVPPYEEIKEGQIRDINTYTIMGAVEEFGGQVVNTDIIKDNYQSLQKAVEKYGKVSDVVIISGGSSVGVKDNTAKVLDSLGEPGVFVEGAAIKPGKPTIISYSNETAYMGLPGHPLSSAIVFSIFGSELFNILFDREMDSEIEVEALSSQNLHSTPGRETYQAVNIYKENGKRYFKPILGKSASISTIVKADGLLKIDVQEEGVSKDEVRKIILI
jgi:molybdopterin molybdotransferase